MKIIIKQMAKAITLLQIIFLAASMQAYTFELRNNLNYNVWIITKKLPNTKATSNKELLTRAIKNQLAVQPSDTAPTLLLQGSSVKQKFGDSEAMVLYFTFNPTTKEENIGSLAGLAFPPNKNILLEFRLNKNGRPELAPAKTAGLLVLNKVGIKDFIVINPISPGLKSAQEKVRQEEIDNNPFIQLVKIIMQHEGEEKISNENIIFNTSPQQKEFIQKYQLVCQVTKQCIEITKQQSQGKIGFEKSKIQINPYDLLCVKDDKDDKETAESKGYRDWIKNIIAQHFDQRRKEAEAENDTAAKTKATQLQAQIQNILEEIYAELSSQNQPAHSRPFQGVEAERKKSIGG